MALTAHHSGSSTVATVIALVEVPLADSRDACWTPQQDSPKLRERSVAHARSSSARQAMSERPKLELVPIEELQRIKGVAFPADMTFRQLLVTGPPGSGKSRLIIKVGGWPEEGYIDLTLKNWWRAQSLTFRPREVHLGFPFVGHDKALTVFDQEWLEAPQIPRLDYSRIVLPPAKSNFLAVKWRHRFVFEFLIPPPEAILKWRLERSRREAHPVDQGVTLEQVEKQAAVYREAALYFHRSGMLTYVRDEYDGIPKNIVDTEQAGSRTVEVSQWGT